MNKLFVVPLHNLTQPNFGDLNTESLTRWAEIVSGRYEHHLGVGGLVNFTTKEWLQRWREFGKTYPDLSRAINAR